MFSKIYYWFIVIVFGSRPFVNIDRMLRLNVAIFLRLLLIRYNAYTELIMDLRGQLKMLHTTSTIKDKLSDTQKEEIILLIEKVTDVVNKRKTRADTIEWKLTELWDTKDIRTCVKSIAHFIVEGNQCTTKTPKEYYNKISKWHYIIFKSRKFITHDLQFTTSRGFIVSVVGCMVYYFLGGTTTDAERAILGTVAFTSQILLACVFFNGVRNMRTFFGSNPSEYTEIYNLDGRHYDNFMNITNMDFLLDGLDIHELSFEVDAIRTTVLMELVPSSREKVFSRVIRAYTLRNIDVEDPSVRKIMEFTKDIRLAHETKDKTLEAMKDVLHSLG